VAIRYSDAAHRFSPVVQFLGKTTLLQSVWRMLSARGLCVHVDLLLPQGARHADRRALSEHLRALIHAQLHATPAPAEPAAQALGQTALPASAAPPEA
jgi:1-acyl-sn-glycerol-3-phosphate acyltransferase